MHLEHLAVLLNLELLEPLVHLVVITMHLEHLGIPVYQVLQHLGNLVHPEHLEIPVLQGLQDQLLLELLELHLQDLEPLGILVLPVHLDLLELLDLLVHLGNLELLCFLGHL